MRWNSGSTPAISFMLRLAHLSTRPSSTSRGACATGLPSIHGSPATHATSGFHGNWMTESASGMQKISGWAGVMSSQVAKPAKPAPDFCMLPTASAGTSLARWVPNRSVKLKRKNFTFLSLAYLARSPAMKVSCFQPWLHALQLRALRFADDFCLDGIGDEAFL